jgi:hypothetical protein
MLKLTIDNLVVTSYATAPADGGDERMAPNTQGCPNTSLCPVPSTFYAGCATYNCTGTAGCTTGGGYAC